ncbi:hypothetical protein U0070_012343 [Myodes glareolus]|uniref:Uncharacterized protein n=1 Tax=Myodes glareolus TaxID=447135 RepID=A0AAW0IZE9_MYOGA
MTRPDYGTGDGGGGPLSESFLPHPPPPELAALAASGGGSGGPSPGLQASPCTSGPASLPHPAVLRELPVPEMRPSRGRS